MSAFAVLLDRITKVGIFLGGVFLILGMLILMSNIFGRFVHFVIPGSYELFELIMVIPVAFALVHAALQKTHVAVHLIVSRFPPRLGALTEILASLLSFAIWALIAWGGARMAWENGLQETTDILGVPYLPFRILWLFCLFLFCLTYLLDLSRTLRRLLRK
jgi:TRAP-type C4-dicarboxylate transport system permease small subunit